MWTPPGLISPANQRARPGQTVCDSASRFLFPTASGISASPTPAPWTVPSPAILSARQAHQPTTIPFNRFHRFRRFGHRPSTPLACRVPVSRLALPPASPSLASESSLRSAPVRDGTVQQVPSMFARPSSQPKTERETAGGLALTDWSSQSTAPSSSSSSSSSSWAITATAVCPAPPTPPPSLSTMPDSMHVGT